MRFHSGASSSVTSRVRSSSLRQAATRFTASGPIACAACCIAGSRRCISAADCCCKATICLRAWASVSSPACCWIWIASWALRSRSVTSRHSLSSLARLACAARTEMSRSISETPAASSRPPPACAGTWSCGSTAAS